MFEVAEIGHKLSKKQFAELAPQLHTRLLEAQFRLQKTGHSVVIIVSGVEGAGKGGVVNRLNEWLDSRGITTNAFWDETDEQAMRPAFWRFWRTLPARGNIGILFGSWYTRPIVKKVFGEIDAAEFERQLKNICEFERMLADDGVIIIKLWFHLSKHVAAKKLEKEAKSRQSPPETKKFLKQYDAFLPVSEQALRDTEQSNLPWHIIEASDEKYRDATAATIVLDTLLLHLDKDQNNTQEATLEIDDSHLVPNQPTILDHVNLNLSLSKKSYDAKLRLAQNELNQLSWEARKQKKSVVAVFEGWDAGGKGSAIRRVTQSIDARLYKVISTAAPTDEEAAHHYLWRFWRQIPLAGYVTIYDRSWYGRVLVERVEKFARNEEWKRSYAEINHFEEQLHEHGIIICKFWIHISPEEQLRRFEERANIAWKQHKITDEDWRNRERWDDYKVAIDDMVAHTSTQYAPWTLVPGNDKKYARIHILETLSNALKNNLDKS